MNLSQLLQGSTVILPVCGTDIAKGRVVRLRKSILLKNVSILGHNEYRLTYAASPYCTLFYIFVAIWEDQALAVITVDSVAF